MTLDSTACYSCFWISTKVYKVEYNKAIKSRKDITLGVY